MLPDWNASDLANVSALLDAAAQNYGVPRDVLYAVASQESQFVAGAVNNSGAVPSYGIMQLELATAQGLGYPSNDPTDLLNPVVNIPLGAAYLASMIANYGLVDGLAAYNGGYIGGQIVGSANQYVAAVQSRIAYFDAQPGFLATTGSVSTETLLLFLFAAVAVILLAQVLT